MTTKARTAHCPASPEDKMALSFTLNEAEKTFLGRQAVTAIQSVFDNDMDARPLLPEPADFGNDEGKPALNRDLGSFVTLSLQHNLRGCIGTIIGHEPLCLNVWNMARAAAFQDPRFPPLRKNEWPDVSLEISVLDQPSDCPDPSKIVIGRDGLILQYQGRSGVFLPQVPVEQGWNPRQYLDHLCLKAGVPVGSWQRPGARLLWYQALVFPVAR